MSAVAPFVNSFLGNQMHQQNPVPPSESVSAIANKAAVIRKQYNDRGYDEHAPHAYVQHHYAKGGGYGKKKSRSVALSALTLLAFLFFLHILQQCIQDHQTQADVYPPLPAAAAAATTTTASSLLVLKVRGAEKKEAQNRVGETDKGDEKSEATAGREGRPVARVDRPVAVADRSELYQYGNVHHVPVKMTMARDQ